MAEDNVAIARAALDEFSRRDLAPLFERFRAGDPSALEDLRPFIDLVDDEIEWDASGLGMPGLEMFHGPEGVVRFWIQWLQEWRKYSFEVSHFEAIGAHVVYDAVVRGEGRLGGAPGAWPHSQVLTFRDGKVVRFRAFRDRKAALAAAEGTA